MTTILAQPQSNADTISTGLGLLFMGDGFHDDTWGEQNNGNLALIEQALCGVTAVDLSQAPGNDVTLTLAQAVSSILLFSGALTSDAIVVVPAVPRRWIVVNQTTGAHNLIVEPQGGIGITVPQAGSSAIYCDGTNIGQATSDVEPVGSVKEYAGVELPSTKYAWANGQALGRSSYPALLAALTRMTTATVGSNAVVLPVTEDLTGRGLVGAFVEGVGVPSNTVVVAVSANSVQLSQATTGAAVQRTIQFFPWGNGDGSTTFNVPDRRGRVAVGWASMGASAASDATGKATGLNAVFGEAAHGLALSEIPSHGHAVNDPGHAHAIADPGHSHTFDDTVIQNATSGNAYGSAQKSNGATASATTGISIKTATTGIALANTGGDVNGNTVAHNNLQPTLATNYIIRVL